MTDLLRLIEPVPPLRDNCCGDCRKPCSYHEGWEDALDVGREVVLREVTPLELVQAESTPPLYVVVDDE